VAFPATPPRRKSPADWLRGYTQVLSRTLSAGQTAPGSLLERSVTHIDLQSVLLRRCLEAATCNVGTATGLRFASPRTGRTETIQEGDLAQRLALCRSEVTLGPPDRDAAGCVHTVGNTEQRVNILLVDAADRGDGAAYAECSRGEHQVLTGTADVSSTVLGYDEEQDRRVGIVFRVRAVVECGLSRTVFLRNVFGPREPALLAARPIRFHVPLRKLIFKLLVADHQKAPRLPVATAWRTRSRGKQRLEISIVDRIWFQASHGTLGEDRFSQRHPQTINCWHAPLILVVGVTEWTGSRGPHDVRVKDICPSGPPLVRDSVGTGVRRRSRQSSPLPLHDA
jgi:hypothetical protein